MVRPGPRHRPTRSGFTLVELLVTAAVFVIGFVGAFSLFLAGTRARTRADDLTHLSYAATTIAEEIALGAPTGTAPTTLDGFLGSGALLPEPANGTPQLYQYPGDPGIWFAVMKAEDLFGRDSIDPQVDDHSAVARLTLYVYRDQRIEGVTYASGAFLTEDSLVEIARRTGMVDHLNSVQDLGERVGDDHRPDLGETPDTTRQGALYNRLVAAGLAVRQEIIIPRRLE